MPVNVRLRPAAIGSDPELIVLRPLLAFSGITKDSLGAVLPQAQVKAFRTFTDIIVSREVSDSFGRYTVSVPDSSLYYAVSQQAATIDATFITLDSVVLTIDRTKTLQGVTTDNLVGSS